MIVAASHLDAVTFQICSQSFKIMPTAFFAVWLLGQYLTPLQWGSLPVLAVGVVFVTMNGSTPAGAPLMECHDIGQARNHTIAHFIAEEPFIFLQKNPERYALGLMFAMRAEQQRQLPPQDSCWLMQWPSRL